jgi:hypothetical protein
MRNPLPIARDLDRFGGAGQRDDALEIIALPPQSEKRRSTSDGARADE